MVIISELEIVHIKWSSWEHILFQLVYEFIWGQGMPGYTDEKYYGFSIIATEWGIRFLQDTHPLTHVLSQKADSARQCISDRMLVC